MEKHAVVSASVNGVVLQQVRVKIEPNQLSYAEYNYDLKTLQFAQKSLKIEKILQALTVILGNVQTDEEIEQLDIKIKFEG